MKASNIILLSIFLSMLIGGSSLYFVGKYEAKKLVSGEMVVHERNLNEFKTLIIKGKTNIQIEQNDSRNYLKNSDDNGDVLTQSGDTLIIEATKNRCRLYFTNVENLILDEKAHVYIRNMKVDTLNIEARAGSFARINEMEFKNATISTFGTAKLRILNFKNSAPNDYAKFSLSDTSKMDIDNDGIKCKIDIDKGENATFRMY